MDLKIKDFETLLSPSLNGKKVESYKIRNLIAPGENYGSVIVAVDVKLRNGAEELSLVAKMVPPTDFMKQVFNIPVTFKKEVHFYSIIIPTLQKFQMERGCEEIIDFIPKYYGSRLNLTPKVSEVDDDACLLLENIKIKGFHLEDRLKGFGLETAKFIIKDLAVLHAVPIALKLAHPDRFEKLMPFLQNNFSSQSINPNMTKDFIKCLIDCIKNIEECVPYLEKLETVMLENSDYFKSMSDEHEGIFATIIHNDLWVNNTMVLYKDGKISKNALIDFQLVSYGNPGHDLLFFIYSSLNNEIIEEHYDLLINCYYEKFINVLKSLKVDTEEFTFEKLQLQLSNAAKKLQLFHILFMLKPILTEKDNAVELKDFNESNLLQFDNMSDLFYSRTKFTILDFVKKGWL